MTAIALTIAGSDSGGGAGIQADIKTFSALGVYGASVITAVTAQNTHTVSHIEALSLDSVRAQIHAVFNDILPQAVKIGMLGSSALISAVAETLAEYPAVPIILDPVMTAKSGALLLPENAIDTLKTQLIPKASLITPNLPEAAILLGRQSVQADEAAARQLLALGCTAVLLKDGHGASDTITDILATLDGGVYRYQNPRLQTQNTHGTGCTLSAAIASNIAKGLEMPDAVAKAEVYLAAAIAQADTLNIGAGHGPVHHFHAYWNAS